MSKLESPHHYYSSNKQDSITVQSPFSFLTRLNISRLLVNNDDHHNIINNEFLSRTSFESPSLPLSHHSSSSDETAEKFNRIIELNSSFTSLSRKILSGPSVLLIGSVKENKLDRLMTLNHRYQTIETEINKNRGVELIGDQDNNNNSSKNNAKGNRLARVLSLNNEYNHFASSLSAGPSVPLTVDSAPVLPSPRDIKLSTLSTLLRQYENAVSTIYSSYSVPLLADRRIIEPSTFSSPPPPATATVASTNNIKTEKDSIIQEEKSLPSVCPLSRCPISICRSALSLYNVVNYSAKHLLDCIPLSPTIATTDRSGSFDDQEMMDDDDIDDRSSTSVALSDNESEDNNSIGSNNDNNNSGLLNQSTQSLDSLLPEELLSLEEEEAGILNNNSPPIRCITNAFEPNDPMRFWLVDQMKNSTNSCCR